jgi:hypothetical protein
VRFIGLLAAAHSFLTPCGGRSTKCGTAIVLFFGARRATRGVACADDDALGKFPPKNGLASDLWQA